MQEANTLAFDEMDAEIAQLKLALLKENFTFRDFYKKFAKKPYSILPELRRQDEERNDFYLLRIRNMELKGASLLGGYADTFHVNEKFIPTVQGHYQITTEDLIDCFNPLKSTDDISAELNKLLPLLFYSPGLTEFGRAQGLVENSTGTLSYSRYEPTLHVDLEPYDRLLKIDLRKKKSRLLAELEHFIDHEFAIQKAATEIEDKLKIEEAPYSLQSAYQWNRDVSRNRINKAWQQIDTWKARRQKKSFPEIANMNNTTVDIAKKSFYRAYELTQGKPYDPVELKKSVWEVRKSEIKTTCGTCPKRDTCDTLCPDVLRYIDQDYIPLKEKYLLEDVDSLRDYLFSRH